MVSVYRCYLLGVSDRIIGSQVFRGTDDEAAIRFSKDLCKQLPEAATASNFGKAIGACCAITTAKAAPASWSSIGLRRPAYGGMFPKRRPYNRTYPGGGQGTGNGRRADAGVLAAKSALLAGACGPRNQPRDTGPTSADRRHPGSGSGSA